MPYFIRYFDKVHIKRYIINEKELTIDSCASLNRLWRALAFLTLWCYHFWPKLASFILNFCRRERSFQWGPDQSDQPNGVWDMHKNALKVEWKTRRKISCHYTWLLNDQICPSQWRFLGSFFNCKQAQQKVDHCSKNKRKGEKGTSKKISKIEKPKDIL